MINYSFANKFVLVTGSSRGMGATMIEAFARAGATCFIQYYPDPQGQNFKDAEEVLARVQKIGAKVFLVGATSANLSRSRLCSLKSRRKQGGSIFSSIMPASFAIARLRK